MIEDVSGFQPWPALISGSADHRCRACIIVPARNEAETLARCLDALFGQVDLQGSPLEADLYEVLLLLNNCTDGSAQVAHDWQRRRLAFALHVVEVNLPQEQAHVGTARRLLMDTAWRRLSRADERRAHRAILSTDADTVVASDWLARNLRALREGADVVGGEVHVRLDDLAALPARVRHCYMQDRTYARLIAEVEDLLDPQEGDPAPRHIDHFGSSLACTPRAYALAGGMPAVSPLEDEAFVDRVRWAGLRLRHDPTVQVYTSSRLEGRAVIGLAGQFRLWSALPHNAILHVQAAAFVEHRFRFMRRLRHIYLTKNTGDLHLPTAWWKNTFDDALLQQTNCPGFLGAVYCNTLIEESFHGQREEPVGDAIRKLRALIMATRQQGAISATAMRSSAAGASPSYAPSVLLESVQ